MSASLYEYSCIGLKISKQNSWGMWQTANLSGLTLMQLTLANLWESALVIILSEAGLLLENHSTPSFHKPSVGIFLSPDEPVLF